MSSYVTPELLYFAVKWSELQHQCNLPRNYSQNTSLSGVIKLRSEGGKTHMCPLNRTSPPLGFSTETLELRAPAVSKTVILSVNASLTHGGLCQPLQLYFVLNEWIIRRPVVHSAPKGSGQHRERTVGCLKVDIHWHTVALLCKNIALFTEN